MKHRALIIEDDADIAESVCDTLESMGHEHAWAKSQEEARQFLTSDGAAEAGFSYVLLDLQIPVRHGRGLPCIEYGEHLAREIHQCPSMIGVPIIAMTAYGTEGFAIAGRLFEHGVVDCINKPFPRTGRTLASVIQSVLDRSSRKREGSIPKHLKPERPFQGGELIFYRDRVELCGVTVLSSGRSTQMCTILDALNQRLDERRYRALPGSALAGLVEGNGGQPSVAGSIRDFRRYVAEQLGRELGLKVGTNDVIETSKAGYRLNAWIVVTDLRQARSRTGIADIQAPQGAVEDPAAARCDQILEAIRTGECLRAPALADRLRCSHSTIKRDLETLKDQGKIRFIGPSKTGHYELTEASEPATVA